MPDDGTIKIYNNVYDLVTFVAKVENIKVFNHNIVYTLVDNTGQIDATSYCEPDCEPDSVAERIRMDEYIRCYGSIYLLDGGKNILIFKIEPILSIREMELHISETAMAFHLAKTDSGCN